MTNSETKMLLKMANTFEQADNILSRTWCKSEADKLEYLQQLFSEELKDLNITDDVHNTYKTVVMTIIHGMTNEPYQYGYKDGYNYGHDSGYDEAVLHIIRNWEELSKLSKTGITEYFNKLLHHDVMKEANY